MTLLEIRDSHNLAKLGQWCTTKWSDGGGEGMEFQFNWRCGGHNGPELRVQIDILVPSRFHTTCIQYPVILKSNA